MQCLKTFYILLYLIACDASSPNTDLPINLANDWSEIGIKRSLIGALTKVTRIRHEALNPPWTSVVSGLPSG